MTAYRPPIGDMFTLCRETVSAETAAARYGLEINNRHRAACPFHGGKHLNLSFQVGAFYCFKCNVGGDVIKFTQLYHGFEKPIDALRQLNLDFNLGLPLDYDNSPPRIDKSHMAAVKLSALTHGVPSIAERTLLDFAASCEYVARSGGLTQEQYMKMVEENGGELPGELAAWARSMSSAFNADYADYIMDELQLLDDGEKFRLIDTERGIFTYAAGYIDRVQGIRLS